MNAGLKLAYLGTAYCGWQVQPNGISVQKRVQDAIQEAFAVPVTLTGCSRTDAGVHARGFVCKVCGLPDGIPMEKLPEAIGRKLPSDIAVREAFAVSDTFHPRYDAKGKRYRYRVRNARVADPFDAAYTALWSRPIDEKQADALCRQFVGRHDFRSFMAAGSDITDTVRTLQDFSCKREGELVLFDVAADGFLYNMARILVGTVLELCAGSLTGDPASVLEARDRSAAGRTMPAHGLCLEEVYY